MQTIKVQSWDEIPAGYTGIVEAYWGRYWLKDREYHREDGPAIESNDGVRMWFIEGERHRLDGPAVEEDGEEPEYWLYDVRCKSKEEHAAIVGFRKFDPGASYLDLLSFFRGVNKSELKNDLVLNQD